MSYLTQSKLDSVVDLPIALPSTTLQQGDWIVVASVEILSPMTLTYRYSNLTIVDASVDTSLIEAVNKIYSNLGLVYMALWLNYSSGTSPGAAGAADVLIATDIGTVERDTNSTVTLARPGVYSWIIANNCQPSGDPLSNLDPSLSIDFTVTATGMVRLDLGAIPVL